jgi:hypothetical protein
MTLEEEAKQAMLVLTQTMLELTQREIIKAQIKENDSILEMLERHGDVRSYFMVYDRIKELEEQLTEL